MLFRSPSLARRAAEQDLPWRELQRQRDSLLYERIGLSDKRDEVLKLAREGALAESPAAQLRDPYVFEFLGIERRRVMAESDLEGALVDHLQQFLFELGRDFCFVARQFRISSGTIGARSAVGPFRTANRALEVSSGHPDATSLVQVAADSTLRDSAPPLA